METREPVVEICRAEVTLAWAFMFVGFSAAQACLNLLQAQELTLLTIVPVVVVYALFRVIGRRAEVREDRLRIHRPLWTMLGRDPLEIPLARLQDADLEGGDRVGRLVLTGADLESSPLVSKWFLHVLNQRISEGQAQRRATIAEGLQLNPEPSDIRCPYCRDEVQDGFECTSCHTLQHADCAAEHGRCVTLGCDARIAA